MPHNRRHEKIREESPNIKGDLPMNVRKVTAKSYKKATKKEKGKILDSLQELTGFNRTYLARILRTFSFKKEEKKRIRRFWLRYGVDELCIW